MRDYRGAAKGFNYQQTAAAVLQGSLEALNACVECCDRHVGDHRIALNCENRDGDSAQYSFEQLQEAAARLANVL
ncbi:MAG: AMP-binding protein, partial [Pseudomonas sp.]